MGRPGSNRTFTIPLHHFKTQGTKSQPGSWIAFPDTTHRRQQTQPTQKQSIPISLFTLQNVRYILTNYTLCGFNGGEQKSVQSQTLARFTVVALSLSRVGQKRPSCCRLAACGQPTVRTVHTQLAPEAFTHKYAHSQFAHHHHHHHHPLSPPPHTHTHSQFPPPPPPPPPPFSLPPSLSHTHTCARAHTHTHTHTHTHSPPAFPLSALPPHTHLVWTGCWSTWPRQTHCCDCSVKNNNHASRVPSSDL